MKERTVFIHSTYPTSCLWIFIVLAKLALIKPMILRLRCILSSEFFIVFSHNIIRTGRFSFDLILLWFEVLLQKFDRIYLLRLAFMWFSLVLTHVICNLRSYPTCHQIRQHNPAIFNTVTASLVSYTALVLSQLRKVRFLGDLGVVVVSQQGVAYLFVNVQSRRAIRVIIVFY